MRIAILSDVHGNREALEAVLGEAEGCDRLWNLGDTIGYGPDPVGCIDRLAALRPDVTLVGNHDLAGIGLLDLDQFNLVARQATEWTASRLDATHREALARLPQTATRGDATLAHGSPRAPIWEYVISADTAAGNMASFTTQLCFVGHTHVAATAIAREGSRRVRFNRAPAGTLIDVAYERAIINPGSVGQPRDGDPRAAWLIYDVDRATVEMRRTAYPIERTQRAIVAAGMPLLLAQRLALGR